MITRLLVDELTLPAPIMDQWTEWELSQFVIRIICTLYVLPGPLLFCFSLDTDTPLAGVANQAFMTCPNITALRSSYALIRRIMPSVETATVQWSQGVTTVHLVAIRRWRGWPERGGGCVVLGPVSVLSDFVVALCLICGLSGCRVMVEKFEGCDNVTCRCGM